MIFVKIFSYNPEKKLTIFIEYVIIQIMVIINYLTLHAKVYRLTGFIIRIILKQRK